MTTVTKQAAPLSLAAIERWPEFATAVFARLEEGRHQYGDHSFLRPPQALAAEASEELLDVCGWAFVLWIRLDALRHQVASAEGAVR